MVAFFHLLTAPIAPLVYLFDFFTQYYKGLPLAWSIVFGLVGVVDYVFARTRYFRVSTWITIIMVAASIPVTLSALPGEQLPYFTCLVGILLAGILMEFKPFIWVCIFYLHMLFLMVIISTPAEGIHYGAIVLLLIICGLVVMLRQHQGWLEALRQREKDEYYQRQMTLLNAAFDGTAIIHQESFLEVSPGFANLFLKTPEEMVGEEISSSLPPGLLEKNIVRGQQKTISFLAPDGSLKFVQYVSETMKANSEKVVAIRDVTKQQLQRAELQFTDRMVSAGTIAAGVAHEVNTPLMVVMEEFEQLTESLHNQDEIKEKGIEHIHSGLHHIAEIIKDLKQFTRPDGDDSVTDIRNLIESTLRLAQHSIGHKCKVEMKCSNNPKASISKGRLTQVLMNLLLNAAHARNPDKEICSIEILTTNSTEQHLVIDVIDDGAGVPLHLHDKIFEPFFTTKENEGTGLGLSICQSILSAVGGQLSLVKSDDMGSHFRITVPNIVSDAPEPSRKMDKKPVFQKARILLIDDNEDILDLLSESLASHQVIACTNIEQSWEFIETNTLDLIICDLILPGISGQGLYRKLEALQPKYIDRLIFITGGAVDGETQNFLNNLDRPTLFKPFSQKDLHSLVNVELARLSV
jgi:signal transduction histidine kinase